MRVLQHLGAFEHHLRRDLAGELLVERGVALQPLGVEALADLGGVVDQRLELAFDEEASAGGLESGGERELEGGPGEGSLRERGIPRVGCAAEDGAGSADAASVAEVARDALALLEGALSLAEPTMSSDTGGVSRTVEEW